MNIVDSSGWLEYFADGPNAGLFAPAITSTSNLLVPTVTIYEVFKRVLQQRSEGNALNAIAAMREGTVIGLSESIAMSAAKLSTQMKLPMADSIILATARAHAATLFTQDAHFKGIRNVRYIEKT
jgi:predicted nucleic acid-binding protein